MQDETAPKVNAVPALLKVFVITGGVVLLIGAILLAVMIALQGFSSSTGDPPESPDAAVDLALPEGVRIGQMVVDGRRLVLLGEGPDGRQYIAVVDPETGARQSLIRLVPEE